MHAWSYITIPKQKRKQNPTILHLHVTKLKKGKENKLHLKHSQSLLHMLIKSTYLGPRLKYSRYKNLKLDVGVDIGMCRFEKYE